MIRAIQIRRAVDEDKLLITHIFPDSLLGFFLLRILVLLFLRLILARYLRAYFAGISWQVQRTLLPTSGDRKNTEKRGYANEKQIFHSGDRPGVVIA